MAIPAPISVLREYPLIDPTDDALAHPDPGAEPTKLDDEDEAAFAARHAAWQQAAKTAAEDFARRFQIATETGKWDGLLVEGRQPTIFRVRQIPLTAWDAFRRVAATLGEVEQTTLAFRLGVVRIDNLTLGVAIETKPYLGADGRRERAFGDVLSEDVVNALALAPGGADVVLRIGFMVMAQRGGAPLGKS